MPLNLDCKATGFPLPLVTWFRGNQVLLNQSNSDTSLVRRNLTNADAGIYMCKAENPVGNDNYTVEVNVIGEFFTEFI